jgi:hypothetical protein
MSFVSRSSVSHVLGTRNVTATTCWPEKMGGKDRCAEERLEWEWEWEWQWRREVTKSESQGWRSAAESRCEREWRH